MKIWQRRGWNGHWPIGIGQERCGEGRQCGGMRYLWREVEERGENGYLDTHMRSEIRIVLNLLLGEGRGGLAR